ncbi:hypothetical protein CDAR_421461 [Caerostris darwini]|uniref:Uncharacterized protein n=1 Tax=Caerostris darwini TaxID=1538125 RepID=A0AAV4SWQ8_9ARAC|nr:hypothetical protein CDAR_421461 [Caerostris darwini]
MSSNDYLPQVIHPGFQTTLFLSQSAERLHPPPHRGVNFALMAPLMRGRRRLRRRMAPLILLFLGVRPMTVEQGNSLETSDVIGNTFFPPISFLFSPPSLSRISCRLGLITGEYP